MLTHDKSSHGLWPGELKMSETRANILYFIIRIYNGTNDHRYFNILHYL